MKLFVHIMVVIFWAAVCNEIVGHGAFEGIGWWLAFIPIAVISQAAFTTKPRK